MQKDINVLLVDDDENMLDFLEPLYQAENYDVFRAVDSIGALEIVKAKGIDLLVTDLIIPGMNGIELIEECHRIRNYLATVLITGQGSEEDAVKAFTYGKVNYYLKKPFNNEELVRFSKLAITQMESARLQGDIQEEIKKQVEKGTAEIMEKNKLLEEKEAENRKLMETIRKEKEKIQKRSSKLERLSITDELTQIFNHRHFNQEITEWFERSERYKTAISLITMDIDNFKRVNDTYGHLSGDKVLRRLGEVLKREKRKVDITARCGGEEFSVLLPQIGLDNAKVVAERIRKAVEAQDFLLNGAKVKVAVSVGVAAYPGKNVKSAKDLIRLADEALYYAKNIGKNRVCLHTERGLVALGEGETFTTEQKDGLRESIIDFVSSHIRLDEICSFLLKELFYFFSSDHKSFYGSVYTLQEHGGFHLVESRGKKTRDIFLEEWMQSAALTNNPMHTETKDSNYPFSSLPIFTADKSGRKKTIAVLNINKVPVDTEFLTSLLNAISIAVRDAIIREELDRSIQRNQQKVVELSIMNNSLMEINRMAMRPQSLTDIDIARRLIKNLKYMTYPNISALMLSNGDDFLIPFISGGDKELSEHIKLGELSGISRIKRLILSTGISDPEIYTEEERITSDDKKVLHLLGVKPPVALISMWNGEKSAGVFLFERQEWDYDSVEMLKNFFTHLALTIQNIRLASHLADQNKRYDVLSDFCVKLNDVETHEMLRYMIEPDLRGVGSLLNAGAVSVYSYDKQTDDMKLLFGTKPAKGAMAHAVVKGKRSPLMRHVIEMFTKNGIREPIVIKDVADFLKRSARNKFAGGAYIGAPIYYCDNLVGILNVTDLNEETGLSEKDIQITFAFASLLGITIKGIALAEGFVENPPQRKALNKDAPKKTSKKTPKKTGKIKRNNRST